MFQKATRKQAKLRMALVGPSGSGKTYTALRIAKGIGGSVALMDTEHSSASLYADEFDFDTVAPDSFSPERYVEIIHEAERAGYNVLVIDSLSHAWTGKDGALEQVDRAASREKNSFAAWRHVTPKHNDLVETMLRCNLHLIVTMRSKTEYIIETEQRNGKTVQVPRKVGMAPVQRDGMEYEFSIVGDMDYNHQFVVSKTRYRPLADAVLDRPGEELGRQLREWLESGEATVLSTGAPKQESANDLQIEAIIALTNERNVPAKEAGKLSNRLTVGPPLTHEEAIATIAWLEKLPKAEVPA